MLELIDWLIHHDKNNVVCIYRKQKIAKTTAATTANVDPETLQKMADRAKRFATAS